MAVDVLLSTLQHREPPQEPEPGWCCHGHPQQGSGSGHSLGGSIPPPPALPLPLPMDKSMMEVRMAAFPAGFPGVPAEG